MPHYDLSSLLAPIEEAKPAGENLEYDTDFTELERIATPKSERAVGDTVKAAEEPEWDKVAPLAEALLRRSKDLRAAMHLAAAWTRNDGLPGWNSGLGLIHGLLENYWDGVHPQLDAEDDNDPTVRVNTVVALGDPQGLLGYFRTAAFVQSPRLGRYSLRDLRIANGTITAPTDGAAAPTMVEIDACCMDCAEDQLTGTAALIDESLFHAQAIDTIFTEQIGAAGPDLKLLLGDIKELKKYVDAQMVRRFPALAVEYTEENPDDSDPEAAVEGSTGRGRIKGPKDVLYRIDEICDYYDRNEPSSPVPILLRRAKRLVGMTFLDLLKDLAPGGISELEVISGPENQE